MGFLDGRVAIISGSGRGIGKATAKMFAGQGAAVVINDLDPKPAEETAHEIIAEGGRAATCVGSVVDEGFAERFVKTALDSFGRLDCIVNNAGYTWDAVIQNMTDEQWYAMIDVHATAPFRILRAAAPYIREAAKKEAARGERVQRKVVQVSSLGGVTGNGGQANYCAAKAAMIGLTKSLAHEWGRYNVNVNAVAYGWILTRLTGTKEETAPIAIEGKEIPVGVPGAFQEVMRQMIPLGRPGSPSEAAGPILFLCSPLADFVSGQVVVVDGGWSRV